jgi:hypothetical protein
MSQMKPRSSRPTAVITRDDQSRAAPAKRPATLPWPRGPGYLNSLGNTIRFGKLMMSDADMQLRHT